MTGFVLIISGLTLLCLFLLFRSLISPRQVVRVDMERENLAIARERLNEAGVETHLENGDMTELEATLLADLSGPDYRLQNHSSRGRWSAIGLLLVTPIVAGWIYTQVGDTRWLAQTETHSAAGAPLTEMDVQNLLTKLEQNLERHPENADQWAIAGRTYMVLNQFAKAEAAYAQVHALVGDDPDILTAWADASLMHNGGLYTPNIFSRIERALELDPVQVNALWLGAFGSRSLGDHESARDYLVRLRPLLANHPDALAQLESHFKALPVTESAEMSNGDIRVTDQSTSSAQSAPARIPVEISIVPELQPDLDPNTPVFVFARAIQGSRLPLAVKRMAVGDLPQTAYLDDESAMVEGRTLSSQKRVVVTARVSLSGNPMAQRGDLTSESIEVAARSKEPVRLSIARRIP